MTTPTKAETMTNQTSDTPENISDFLSHSIERSLNQYRCQNLNYDDGAGGMVLVDVLTPDGDEDISRGTAELELLVEHIWMDLEPTLSARFNALERELAAERAKNAWQPIETAPDDGRYFIARAYHDRTNEVVHVVGRFEEDGFYMEDRSELSFNFTIKHWIPLPAAPEYKP